MDDADKAITPLPASDMHMEEADQDGAEEEGPSGLGGTIASKKVGKVSVSSFDDIQRRANTEEQVEEAGEEDERAYDAEEGEQIATRELLNMHSRTRESRLRSTGGAISYGERRVGSEDEFPVPEKKIHISKPEFSRVSQEKFATNQEVFMFNQQARQTAFQQFAPGAKKKSRPNHKSFAIPQFYQSHNQGINLALSGKTMKGGKASLGSIMQQTQKMNSSQFEVKPRAARSRRNI